MAPWANATAPVLGISTNLNVGTALPAVSGGECVTMCVPVAL